MRSFFSLLLSFALVSLGDIVNLSIANNISFAAIGVMGAYYTINWIAKEITNFGVYTYRVERCDEWQYLQLALICGLVGGIAVSALSGIIPNLFGINDAQRTALSGMLALYFIALPAKSMSIASLEMTRLRGQLADYRHMVILFYAVSISLNLALFVLFCDVRCILITDIVSNLTMVAFAIWRFTKQGNLPFALLGRKQISCALRFGSPLVGERLVQRGALAIYGVCASYMSPEMFAIHTVCLNAVYMGDVGDQAYSAALLVLVPDKSKEAASNERYFSERARMIAYRRKTAVLAILFSFSMSYVAAIASHADVDLVQVLWFTFFYGFSFIPMCISTPGKDFLTIQKKSGTVMLATMCGAPAYIICPLLALFVFPPEAALYLFGLTGTVQIVVRALIYTRAIRKMDTDREISLEEVLTASTRVVLGEDENSAPGKARRAKRHGANGEIIDDEDEVALPA